MTDAWISRKYVLALAAAGLGLALSACVGGPSEPSRFYVLSSPADLAVAEKRGDVTLGVGPVKLPPHLDRTQIVTQTTRHRLNVRELDQWAEPLKDGVTRVLAQNLSRLADTDGVFQFPWRRPITVEYQIAIDVQQFDTDAQGNSVLTARWDLIRGDGRELIHSQTSSFKNKVAGPGMEPVVAAMSANLTELSREIATGVAALTR